MRTLTTSATSFVIDWPGGAGDMSAWGTWAGATVTLTWQYDDDSTAVPIQSGVSLSADGSVGFMKSKGKLVVTLTGGDETTTVEVCIGLISTVGLI